jgi:4-amino-4-deoxy-L-arabinose transferase-like glycosyltransferase
VEEPSVLDYVKAKIKFWQKSELRIPPAVQDMPLDQFFQEGEAWEAEPARGPSGTQEPATVASEQDASASNARSIRGSAAAGAALAAASRPRAEAYPFPWLALLPAAAALAAQAFLEPPARFSTPAVILYMAAALLAVFAYRRGELVPAVQPSGPAAVDDMEIRWGYALAAAPMALLAFVLMGGNHFSPVNALLWLGSIGLFLAAFFKADAAPQTGRLHRIWVALRRPGPVWNLPITRWTMLVLALLLLIGYFRFYHLDTLPVDMVSDHAEKLMDVNDLLDGNTWIFFERNTGREPFQFYWTALVIQLFDLDVSFFSLKLGTALVGLITAFYVYRLGGLIGGRWVALFALLFVGVAYWPNIISRIALRFPLYPFFVAPLLFHLIRGLRSGNRNDFLWAGLWLGIGLNGYTSGRVVPLLVLMVVALYMLHRVSRGYRQQALMNMVLVAFFALLVSLPLFRYLLEHPEAVLFRSMTRLGSLERPLPGAPIEIFMGNLWSALTMFFYSNGSIWVHSIPYRPALDIVMAGLFFVGLVLLMARAMHRRGWEDWALLLSIPVLLLPSVLSLAFPDENPSLNRASAAYVPVMVIAAVALDALLRGLVRRLPGSAGRPLAVIVGVILVAWTIGNNYNLFFVQYNQNYRQNAWNTREIGLAVRDFAHLTGTYETYYVVGFPYWIDSRQVAIFAGHIRRDPGIMPERLTDTAMDARMKLFIVKPEDTAALQQLRQLYPLGNAELRRSDQPGKDFVLFLVPGQSNLLP